MGKRLALLICFAALIAAEPASAAYPGSDGRIAFTRPDGYIYTVKPDATGLIRLGLGTQPSWSPDGTRIAFVRNGDIWAMAANGSNPQRVTTSKATESDPTWSSDGSTIAFASTRGTGGIYALHSTQPYGTAVLFEATPYNQYAPSVDLDLSWATNGWVYFTRYSSSGGSFCDDSRSTMRVNPIDGTTERIVLWGIEPDPRPRSGGLVYALDETTVDCQGVGGIYISRIDGTNPQVVTPNRTGPPPADSDPVFAPSGSWIAFQRGRYLYLVKPDGTKLHRLILGRTPSWQPIP
jgi:Tol biopolymer transport system component